MTRTPREKSITDILIDLGTMNKSMEELAGKIPAENYRASVHYLGMNYDLHLMELRSRGQHTIADKYQRKAEWWKQ